MALLRIIKTITMAGLFLATFPAMSMAKPTQCQMTSAPVINIRPQTKEIQYDVKKTSAELSQLKTNTISPYGLGTDQTTGGLRHDQPTMVTEIKYNFVQNRRAQTICLSYHTINIDILLQPKIYIAKEFNHGRCAREVIKHEKKHVAVDRKVMNKYTKLMGLAIQEAVNKAGVIGPFPMSQSEELQKMMGQNIENAVGSIKLSLANEMNALQQKVDSREEYEYVSQFCKRAAKKVHNARQKQLKKQQR